MNKSRRNLVIVRAGDSSLHPAWLAGPGERSWDLVVSYFGKSPTLYRSDDELRIDGAGPKWPALQDLLQANPQWLLDYKYIWLPDDDLQADKASINRMFDLMGRHHLEVAQPALTWNSYFGHVTTLQNRCFRLRFTNYVEVMAPCMEAVVLRQVLPLLNANLSGWGLDFIWPRYVRDRANGVAIIDAVTVRHTRPVGGPNYQKLREGGISPWDELRTFCRSNGLHEAPEISTYKAVTRGGRTVMAQGRQRRFLLLFLSGLIGASRHSPEARRMRRRLLGLSYKIFTGKPDRVSETPLNTIFRRRVVTPGLSEARS